MPGLDDILAPAAGPIRRGHFAWPFQIAESGQILMVDQDSDPEIAMAMGIALSWPLGTRDMDPEFGVDEELFLSGGPSADEIRAALAHGEPRALTQITRDDSHLQDFAAAVRVAWSDASQDPDA